MTKADQARAMFLNDPTLSRTEIANALDMYVGQVSQALKSIDGSDAKPLPYKRKPLPWSKLSEAIQSGKEVKIRKWLMSQASDRDWQATFKDVNVTTLVLTDKRLDIYIQLFNVYPQGRFEVFCPHEYEDFVVEVGKIFNNVGKRDIAYANNYEIVQAQLNVQHI